MKIRINKTLDAVLKSDEKWCRLRRKQAFAGGDLLLAEKLCELEASGDAMRHLDSKGRIVWRETPKLRDFVDDLRQDAEMDLEWGAD